MKVVLTSKAQSDREARWSYLYQFSEAAAERTDTLINEHMRLLVSNPNRGRSGRIAGTRELPIGKTRLLAVYRVEQDVVRVLRILHGAQDWPARF